MTNEAPVSKGDPQPPSSRRPVVRVYFREHGLKVELGLSLADPEGSNPIRFEVVAPECLQLVVRAEIRYRLAPVTRRSHEV